MRNWIGVVLGGLALVGGACSSQESTLLTGIGGASGAGAGNAPGGAGGAAGQMACPGGPPPPPVPFLPRISSNAACAAAASGASDWAFPVSDAGATRDVRAYFIGRWLLCGDRGITSVPHDGIELGANNRWRLLGTDPSGGALVPVDASIAGSHGYYYALGNGQFALYGEGPLDGASTFFAAFTAQMDVVRFTPTSTAVPSGGYARVTDATFDGAANLPSVSDGRCSMTGTWAVPANLATPQEPPATITFDPLGNFVGYAQTDPPCTQGPMYGTYRLTPGLFQLTSNVGMGVCQWWFAAAYPAMFDDSCSQLTLMQKYDNCTGGRGYLNGTTVLKRQ